MAEHRPSIQLHVPTEFDAKPLTGHHDSSPSSPNGSSTLNAGSPLGAHSPLSLSVSEAASSPMSGTRGSHSPTRGDVDFKVQMLRQNLSTRMREAVASRPRSSSEPYREWYQHGVDIDALRDIKAVFDSTTPDGVRGVTEDEFMKVFGVSLCAGMTDEQVRVWFRNIDKDCSGRVSWEEISAFLVRYEGTSKPNDGSMFGVDSTTVSAKLYVEAPGTGGQQYGLTKPHTEPISHMCYVPGSDLLYSGGADGVVRVWNTQTLRCSATPVHASSAWVHGLCFLPHCSRVMVLKGDRSISIYDVVTNGTRQGRFPTHTLYKVYGAPSPSLEVDAAGIATYYNLPPKARGAHRLPALDCGMVRQFVPGQLPFASQQVQQPATVLSTKEENYTCFDHVAALPTAEAVIIGMESGAVEQYNLHSSDVPLHAAMRTPLHKGAVTQVRMAHGLEGFISSSVDTTMKVTNLEKGLTICTMQLPPAKRRPVMGFDYAPTNNMLVSSGGRSVHIWNALTGVKNVSLVDHDAPVTKVGLNTANQQVYALYGKCIRIWDIRTWRVLDTIQDNSLGPRTHVSSYAWIDSQCMLVSAAHGLTGWRATDVQERVDAGLPVTEEHFSGHLHPILYIQVCPMSNHIVAVDTTKIVVWSLCSFTLINSWKWNCRSRITCVAPDTRELKILIGCDEGEVAWYNYSCGHRVSRLGYSGQRSEVTFVAHFPAGSSRYAPCVSVAGVSNRILAWQDSPTLCTDMPYTSASTTISDEDGLVMCVAQPSVDGSSLVVGINNGSCIVVSTLSLTVLFRLPSPVTSIKALTPAESITTICPGLFLVTYGDGTAHIYAYENENVLWSVCGFPAATQKDDTVTAVFITDEHLFLGDTSGNVSMFRCPKLLGKGETRRRLLPKIRDKKITEAEILKQNMTLVVNWKAHTQSVTSICMMPDESHLLTSSSDRRLRAWDIESQAIVCDFGYGDILSMTPAVQDLDTRPVHQFVATDGGTQLYRTGQRRLSMLASSKAQGDQGTLATDTPTDPGASSSLLAVPQDRRRTRGLSLVKAASFLQPMEHGAPMATPSTSTQTLHLAPHGAHPSPSLRLPSMGSIHRSQSGLSSHHGSDPTRDSVTDNFLEVDTHRSNHSQTPDGLTTAELFALATRSVTKVRGTQIATVAGPNDARNAMVNRTLDHVNTQLAEVVRIRDRHAQEGKERLFGGLALPAVQRDLVVQASGPLRPTTQQHTRTTRRW